MQLSKTKTFQYCIIRFDTFAFAHNCDEKLPDVMLYRERNHMTKISVVFCALSVFLRTHAPDNGNSLFFVGGKPMKVVENITVSCKLRSSEIRDWGWEREKENLKFLF